ncbi:MAG TPA: class I SAM-dependent methyltransferase [Azospirillaceae bacterium]|nr:class I SAM-dependent methyltransferase [Azospirillaceae bacterium]
MSDWSDGYVTDIDYTHGFYRELTPGFLAFCILLKGLRPPPLSSFSYCELGFGQGFSTNLIAAANPQGDFWATDFNPSHAAGASQLAMSAGTGNVRFYDKSFAEFRDLETPEFDLIVLHGIYSWVSPENRAAIVEIIRRKLKPGGAVYIGYNCLPGWSAAMPLRQLMAEYGATARESRVQQVRQGIAFADRLVEMKAGYFAQNPGVAARLELLKRQPSAYLVHEYLNRDWTPKYFAEVARELGGAKLSFAASANPADHVDVVNLTSDAQKMLAEIDDVLFRETVRDYFLNQKFRKDIFVKGAVRLSAQEKAELLLKTRFVLVAPRALVPLEATFALGDVKLREETYGPVLYALAKGPATLGELLAMDSVRAVGFPSFVQAVTVLAAMRQVEPCLPETGEADRVAGTRAFNAAVMNAARYSDQLMFLASPVTGGGINVNRFHQLFLLAMQGNADPAEFTWQVLDKQDERLTRDGKALESPGENIAELRARAEVFRTQWLPLYRQLGIA